LARRAAGPKVAIDDANRLLEAARQVASLTSSTVPPDRWLGEVTSHTLDCWDRSPVVLRADGWFTEALEQTAGDAEIVADFIDRFPFGAVAVALDEPFTVPDGDRRCEYIGFVATGIRSRRLTGVRSSGPPGVAPAYTTYHPIPESDGIRFVWLFVDGGVVGAQTLSMFVRGEDVPRAGTADELIDALCRSYRMSGVSAGDESERLVRISVGLSLYVAQSEPDLDEVPPERSPRRQALGASATVLNLGWRVGAALRAATSTATDATPATSGRRLPPHLRAAHWHRVRVATRDDAGVIVGSTGGRQGEDWHYELRWYPPAAVNVTDGAGPAPVVRDLGR
jgi:hypothetical protein